MSQSAAKTAATSVIILAAGAGTRMRSARPKMLHEVCGLSMLGHAVRAADGLSPDRIVVVLGHDRELVSAALDELRGDVRAEIVVEIQHEQNGTGDAVRCGMNGIPTDYSGAVVVTTSDVPMLDTATLSDLLAHHTVAPAAAVTVLTSRAPDPTGYGRIVRSTDGEVQSIVEHRDATDEQLAIDEVNSGVYAFEAENLRAALGRLTTDNSQGELYLTDVVLLSREAGRSVRGHRVTDSWRVAGVNDRVQLAAAAKEMNRRICEDAMRGGATLVDPDTTWIDSGVEIGRDVTILPGTQLLGATHIGDGATIGPDTTIESSGVGEGAVVCRSHVLFAEIGAGADVGPFAYLRPAADIGDEGKIGAFVEVKKSQIGRGTKVPHLTYVGDATIGEYTNIGASSVFVNYDGVNKNQTVIGDHCRTGSDTMFIAPVQVGDGAYSGAGTVIKDDVPPGALVVSGGKQRIIENWVIDNRPGSGSAEAARQAQDSTTEDGRAQ